MFREVRYVAEHHPSAGWATGARWSRRAVLLTGLALAGCSHPRPTIQGEADDTAGQPHTQALQAILDRRSAALQHKDEKAWLADLDPADDKLIQQQKMIFANLRQFTFSNFRYVTEHAFGRQEGDGSYTVFPVVQVTQLPADAGPGGVAPAESFRYRIASKDNKLVVTEILPVTQANVEDLGVDTPLANAPWNTTPLKVIRAGDVWLAGDDSVPDLDHYASAAQSQVQKIEAMWGKRLRFPGYVLFFTKSKDNFATWYEFGKATNFSTDVEGIQLPLTGVRTNGQLYDNQYAGSRIVVNLTSTTVGGDTPELVMRHELTHAVTSRATAVSMGGFAGVLSAPTWAVEGFARWMETLEFDSSKSSVRAVVANAVAKGGFKGKLPATDSFFKGDASLNYAFGATAFEYVDRTKGRDAAVEFYAQVVDHNDLESTPFTESSAFQDICQHVMGVSSATFLQQWAGFVRRGV
ncbi:hypothetical protein [Rugosimonospora africana]|uniref:hypothetical protein n=1 Tax=Rugosimonospora africana TaxID=556532 RepID=UPI0019418607|nr:hypothetical protein [Rugosimonospora africana]